MLKRRRRRSEGRSVSISASGAGSSTQLSAETAVRAAACLVESWELRCITPGREDFIYGSIRSKQKEIWRRYLGTALSGVWPFPGNTKKPREELDVANERCTGAITCTYTLTQNSDNGNKWREYGCIRLCSTSLGSATAGDTSALLHLLPRKWY